MISDFKNSSKPNHNQHYDKIAILLCKGFIHGKKNN
jgi:hypothetical protein